LDYDGAKKLAYSKLSQIHELVANKELTIEEAADRIRNDVTLQQVDVAYQTNASFDFIVKNDEKITIDSDFDTVVRATKAGDITEVLPFKEPTTLLGKSIETAYAFAYVKERKTDGKVVSFNDWLTQQKSNYRVVYKYNP
jgi:DNA phosphorothioation-dependent restriction protein DptG